MQTESNPARPLGGEHLVPLDPDHPGFRDPTYRRRRDAIARLALRHQSGQPLPRVEYTAEEHATWRQVRAGLEPLWQKRLARPLLAAERALDLPERSIPQLAEVNDRLRRARAPISYAPVAGLVAAPHFLARLA